MLQIRSTKKNKKHKTVGAASEALSGRSRDFYHLVYSGLITTVHQQALLSAVALALMGLTLALLMISRTNRKSPGCYYRQGAQVLELLSRCTCIE